MTVTELAKAAKKASQKTASLDTKIKNLALNKIAEYLEAKKNEIFEANQNDLSNAIKLVEDKTITEATYNRLKLSEGKFNDMVQGVKDVANLPDPTNKILLKRELDEDLLLTKVSCPIGVIGVIFEARPDVISQISALAIKSGNTVILKGGKEALETNKAIFNTIKNAISEINDFPDNVISLITSREEVHEMLSLDKYIDLIIPRGGNSLVKFIKENTKIPVLGHADGICHIFVDYNADKDFAQKICVDAKTQYPSACNSVETILVHKEYPYLKELINSLKANGVKIKGDKTCQNTDNDIESMTETDRTAEYGEKTVLIEVINDVLEAIDYINQYGSHHTESIITNDDKNAKIFTDLVDSAGVYVNASTRFADGFRYGFGAEVGISTNKTHARGPVGLEGLTIYKYKLIGKGHTVGDYSSGNKKFHHKDIL